MRFCIFLCHDYEIMTHVGGDVDVCVGVCVEARNRCLVSSSISVYLFPFFDILARVVAMEPPESFHCPQQPMLGLQVYIVPPGFDMNAEYPNSGSSARTSSTLPADPLCHVRVSR